MAHLQYKISISLVFVMFDSVYVPVIISRQKDTRDNFL